MKTLNEPLADSGIIPLVEIAKLLYPYWDDRDEDNFINFNNPEFDDKGRMFVSFTGFGSSSAGVSEYLFFENGQFKNLRCDYYWTGDYYKESIEVCEFNQILLLKKLIEIGAITKEEIGL